MASTTASSSSNSAQRKDMLILESLALPGEITSATVGRFLNRKQNTLILAKSTILSLFSYDAEAGKFNLIDHKNVFRQVFSIHTVPQSHSLDCLLVVSVNGEGIFLQWHENDFFPLASGSFMDAAMNIMKNPQRRRFRINPTFQFSVLVIPQEEDQCTYISKPNISPKSKQTQELSQQTSFDNITGSLDDSKPLIDRISFRAICFVEELVCIGISYDGPDSDLMYDLSERMNETLLNIPQICGWGNDYSATLENGLEDIWRAKQKNKEQDSESSEDKERVNIAQVQTFIFTEKRINENDTGKSLMLDTVLRVRHATYSRKMLLPEFPFVSQDGNDHTQDNIASIYTIVDTAEGVMLHTLNLDFTNRTIKLGKFVMVGLPNSASRIIVLHNDWKRNSNQLANELLQSTLKGAELVDVQSEDNVNDSDLLLALKGQKIKSDSDEQQVDIIKAKKLQKLIRSKRSKQKMLAIHIKQQEQTPVIKQPIFPTEILSPLNFQSQLQHYNSEFDSPKKNRITDDFISQQGIQISPSISTRSGSYSTSSSSSSSSSSSYSNSQFSAFSAQSLFISDIQVHQQNTPLNDSFVPYILATQKAIILQHSIDKAYIFPFPNALSIPPFGFCHLNQPQQIIHKLILGGGQDILTIQDGQIQQQHYENKSINDIIIVQPSKHKSRSKKILKVNFSTKPQLHTTAVVTTTSGYPILMQLETGSIKEVADDDDFCLPTGNIQKVVHIPPKWQNKLQIQDDRMALGVANGISGTGELQIVSVGHKLKEIIKDDFGGTSYLTIGSSSRHNRKLNNGISQLNTSFLTNGNDTSSSTPTDTTLSINLTEQAQLRMPVHLQVVCTLNFISDVTSLAAVSICGNQYFVVCTSNPNRARIFRLNSIEDDIEFQKENKKIWDIVNTPQPTYIQKNSFNILQQPSFNPQVPPDEQFIEAKLGDNQFLLNFCCQQLTATPIIDMKLNNPASSCLFTTLERTVKRLGPEEDTMPNEALFGMINGIMNSTGIDEQYKAHEGALLIIGGQYGLVEYVVIPLAALMLNQSPLRYSSAIDVLKIGMQSIDEKLQNSIHELFTFPPESQIVDLGRSPVQISEDNRHVIVKGERTQILRFDPYIGRTIWNSLFNEDGIRSIVPIGALIDESVKKRTQKILYKRKNTLTHLQKLNQNKNIQQQRNQDSQENLSMESTSDISSSLDIEKDGSETNLINSPENQIANPTIAWIGKEENSSITFGVIPKQQRLNKQIRQLSSVPIAITHLASLHSIAVLIREEFKYVNVIKDNQNDKEINLVEKNPNQIKPEKEIKSKGSKTQKEEMKQKLKWVFTDVAKQDSDICTTPSQTSQASFAQTPKLI
ncbi:MAG: hypothetical protein EZS28_014185, partial [Streblomastix strix]